MPITARDPDNNTEGKPYHTSTNQPAVAYVAEQFSRASIGTDSSPVTFIAELDSTPIKPKQVSAPTSTPSKALMSDITVRELDDTNNEVLAREKPSDVRLLEQVAKAKAAKLKDPAVLVNLPTSPSAQAYEVVRDAKNPGDEGYFDPVYADTDDHDNNHAVDKAS